MKKLEQTEIVYRFACKGCSFKYVGESKRSLNTRLEEHINNKQKNSVVTLHKNDEHQFHWDNVKILDKEPNEKKRLISEMIYILNTKNTLNKQTDIDSLSRIYSNLFHSN